MNFTLTISAAPELLAVLEKFAAGLGGLSAGNVSTGESESQETKTRKTRTPKEAPAATPAPEPVDDGLGEDPAPVNHTIESIRARARDIAKIVGADKVRALVKELGFDSLPAMTPDKFDEFAAKVVKLTK